MIKSAAIYFTLAVITAIFKLTGIADDVETSVATYLFYIFVVLFIITMAITSHSFFNTKLK